jgi:hypothetical protein
VPRGDLWTLNTPSRVKHASSVHIAICKIASAEDDLLETDIRSASCGMDAIDHHEVLRGLSVGIVPILVQYSVSFSTALVPQLQL